MDIVNSSYSVKIYGVLAAENVFKIEIDIAKRDLKHFIEFNLGDGNWARQIIGIKISKRYGNSHRKNEI